MALEIAEQKVQRALFYARGDRVILEGEIDQTEPDLFLTPFFNQVSRQMGDILILDIFRLDFINSAAISCILEFLINRKPGSRIMLKVDKTKGWQRYSIHVLQALDSENITLSE